MSDDFLSFYELHLEKVRKADGGNYVALCPFHDDTQQSFCFEAGTGVFVCYGCGERGNVKTFAQKIGTEIPKDLKGRGKIPSRKRGKSPRPIIPKNIIDDFHRKLWGDKRLIQFLIEKRGITLPVIERYSIGWDSERLTIPVQNLEGETINIRRYLPGKEPKMLSFNEGYGAGTLFPMDQLGQRILFLTEGESDALCLISQGLSAITNTNGSRGWKSEWTPFFKGKRVIIVPDNDSPGYERVLDLAREFSRTAHEISFISWEGTEVENIPGGDVTDYFVKCGGSVEAFKELIRPIGEFTFNPFIHITLREINDEYKPGAIKWMKQNHAGEWERSLYLEGKINKAVLGKDLETLKEALEEYKDLMLTTIRRFSPVGKGPGPGLFDREARKEKL